VKPAFLISLKISAVKRIKGVLQPPHHIKMTDNNLLKKWKMHPHAMCSYEACKDLSEHERSVEKRDMKRSASQHTFRVF
jgi:hypothetical protein